MIPILFIAFVSISHVITWYSIMNPISWAIYLSVGIEIAALSALAGLAVKNNKAIYLPFLIVTLIQLIGNMFYVFQYIDITSKLFKDWVILADPLFSMLSMLKSGDVDGHRRWLAVFGGALLPIISLSFLHLLVKFNDKEGDEPKLDTIDLIPNPGTPINDEPKGVQPDIEVKQEIIDSIPEPGFSGEIKQHYIEHTIEEPAIPGNEDEAVNEAVNEVVIEEPAIPGNEDVVYDNQETSDNINHIQHKPEPVKNNQIMRVGPHNEKKTIFFRGKNE
jgi:hypothetical protein